MAGGVLLPNRGHVDLERVDERLETFPGGGHCGGRTQHLHRDRERRKLDVEGMQLVTRLLDTIPRGEGADTLHSHPFPAKHVATGQSLELR